MHGTAAAYARHRDVSREAVRQAIVAGRIVEGDDGLIDFAAANASWEANTDLSKPRNSVTGHPRRRARAATTGLAKHKAEREDWRARREKLDYQTAELEHRQKAGELVPRVDVEKRFEEASRRARQRLEAIPDRMSGKLAAATDPAEVHRLLREEIRVACTELAGDG